MSLASIAATRSSTTQLEPARLESLSPTALLEHGAAVAERYDEQVRVSINGMNDILAASDHVTALRQDVNALLEHLAKEGKDGSDEVTLEGDQLAAFELEPELVERLTNPDNGKVEISTNTLERIDTELQQQQNQINSSQQLRLLSVQEAMRQRGELIQLLSTILRNHSQTDVAIVRNMQ